MPSFWKRIGLAAALTAQMSASPVLTFAQYPYIGNQCTTTQQPCPPTGRAQVVSPDSTTPVPPPWVEPAPGTTPMPPQPGTTPVPSTTPDPGTTPAPSTTPDPGMAQTTPDFTPPSDQALSFNQQQLGIGSPDQAFGPPNMMGDLLRAYRGVTFTYLQAGDQAVAVTGGSVNFRNSKVAENNSAIPRDRVSFRYNYFKNAIQVRGLENSPVLGDPFTIASSRVFQFNEVQPASREFDVHLYTLGLEKTFFDNMASVELRVPFARTLDSSLDLISGVPVVDIPGFVPAVQPTPGQTLGQADTEIQDINLILKAIIAQDPCQRWVVSTGLGVTIPTGEDVDVRVVDYNDDNVLALFGCRTDPGELVDSRLEEAIRRVVAGRFAFDQRTRNFQIENQTWGLAPFLAAAAQPTDRTFVNGFFQIDVPLNSSDWSFSETDLDLEQLAFVQVGRSTLSPVQSTNSASGTIEDQTLMNIDVGAGYWIYQNPHARTVKGVAALAELHYTTTLEDADIVVVPETPITTGLGGSPFNRVGPLDQPRLGNVANRVDFLNLTLGSTILIGNNATLAGGYVVPLRDDLDRTFDGELNVQLNIYR